MARKLTRWQAVARIAMPAFALVGVLVVVGVVVFVAGLNYFGRLAADKILANAIIPTAREMPHTAGQRSYASADIQVIGGRGQGLSCSLPWILTQLAFPQKDGRDPIGLQMRQACAAHDYCYRHGAATYGYTQADCDYMLQEQAFRLCWFIETNGAARSKGDDSECIRSARLVTLGVRIGGSDAFRPLDAVDATSQDAGVDGGLSTYFEYDPYPVRSPGFSAFRIADAPAAMNKSPSERALYYFSLRPAGTVVRVASIGEKPQTLAVLPGDFGHLNSAPFVVRVKNGGAGEDWFVWWQRYGFDNTGGRIVAIAPGRATLADWLCLGTPDRRSSMESDSGPSCHKTSSAVLVASIGTKNHPDDLQFSEIIPANYGSAEANRIWLLALEIHTCISKPKGSNSPCFVYIGLDVNSEENNRLQEQMRVTDSFAPERGKEAQTENDRYRNFVANPIVLRPPGEADPVLIWTRRDSHDSGYMSTAVLRRMGIDRRTPGNDSDDTGRSRGSVSLGQLSEDDEPVFVVGRNSAEPFLASLTSDADHIPDPIRLTEWRLPVLAEGDAAATMPVVPADKESCVPNIDGTWLSRPPSVAATAHGAAVVLSRVVRTDAASEAYQLQTAALAIASDGKCPLGAVVGAEFDVADLIPTVGGDAGKTPAEILQARLAILRGTPLLADAPGPNARLNVILPRAGKDRAPRILCRIDESSECVE